GTATPCDQGGKQAQRQGETGEEPHLAGDRRALADTRPAGKHRGRERERRQGDAREDALMLPIELVAGWFRPHRPLLTARPEVAAGRMLPAPADAGAIAVDAGSRPGRLVRAVAGSGAVDVGPVGQQGGDGRVVVARLALELDGVLAQARG